MSSYPLKTRFESQLSRMNCQTFSTGFSSGERDGRGRSVMFPGTTSAPARCQPARSRMRTAWASGATAPLISSEMLLHRLRVAERHDDAGALALRRTDRTEDVGPGGALVVWRPRPGAAPGPPPGELVLLADPRLVLEPELYALAGMRGADLRHALRETFLKASAASGSWA